jgi:hypothetical protein
MKTLNTPLCFIRNLLYACLAVLLAIDTGTAQPLSVQLMISPRPSPYLSDWTQRVESQVVMTVTNPTSQIRTIYFTGSVTGDNGVSAMTKAGYKPPKGLQVPANTTTSYTGPQLKGLFVWDDIKSTGVNTTQIERSGMLPEGSYTLCVVANDYFTGQLATNLQPSACTPSFTIQFPQPPYPTTPACNAPLDVTSGQLIIFSWTPAANTPPSVQYRLRIVEVMPNQNANEAIQSAPPVIDQKVNGNFYQLNPVKLVTPSKLQKMQFAWTVTAFDPSNKTTFSNYGQSEVCTFSYSNDNAGPQNEFHGIGAKLKIDIGWGPNCIRFGFCKIAIVPDEDSPKSGGVPDSRLMPHEPKVYASVLTTYDNHLVRMSISAPDIKKYQPDKLKYLEGAKFVTFEENTSLSPVLAIIIPAGDYPIVKTGEEFQIFFDLNPDPKVKRPGDYGDLEDEPCNRPETTSTWHRTGYCYVDKMAHKECGEIKDKDKIIKKLEEFVKEHGGDWGKDLMGDAVKEADAIKSVVTIYRTYDFYVHVVRDFCDRLVIYKCVNGKWVGDGGKIISAGTEDLGWVKLMIPQGDLSLCWTGNESIGDLRSAISAALSTVCGGSPTIVK